MQLLQLHADLLERVVHEVLGPAEAADSLSNVRSLRLTCLVMRDAVDMGIPFRRVNYRAMTCETTLARWRAAGVLPASVPGGELPMPYSPVIQSFERWPLVNSIVFMAHPSSRHVEDHPDEWVAPLGRLLATATDAQHLPCCGVNCCKAHHVRQREHT